MGMNIRQSHFYVGADLGQSNDPTAIVVLERQWGYLNQADGEHDLNTPLTFYRVRHMERLPLGMDYVQQVQYIGSVMRRAPLNGAELLIDFTGVGRPVFDIFNQHGIRAEGVNITAGNQETQEMHGWNVAKQILISTVQAELHSGRLRVNKDLADAPILECELQDFQVSITPSGNATFNARVGRHDDLVLALAIALWRAVNHHGEKAQRVPFTGGY